MVARHLHFSAARMPTTGTCGALDWRAGPDRVVGGWIRQGNSNTHRPISDGTPALRGVVHAESDARFDDIEVRVGGFLDDAEFIPRFGARSNEVTLVVTDAGGEWG